MFSNWFWCEGAFGPKVPRLPQSRIKTRRPSSGTLSTSFFFRNQSKSVPNKVLGKVSDTRSGSSLGTWPLRSRSRSETLTCPRFLRQLLHRRQWFSYSKPLRFRPDHLRSESLTRASALICLRFHETLGRFSGTLFGELPVFFRACTTVAIDVEPMRRA